jgi:hypothetical protein
MIAAHYDLILIFRISLTYIWINFLQSAAIKVKLRKKDIKVMIKFFGHIVYKK